MLTSYSSSAGFVLILVTVASGINPLNLRQVECEKYLEIKRFCAQSGQCKHVHVPRKVIYMRCNKTTKFQDGCFEITGYYGSSVNAMYCNMESANQEKLCEKSNAIKSISKDVGTTSILVQEPIKNFTQRTPPQMSSKQNNEVKNTNKIVNEGKCECDLFGWLMTCVAVIAIQAVAIVFLSLNRITLLGKNIPEKHPASDAQHHGKQEECEVENNLYATIEEVSEL